MGFIEVFIKNVNSLEGIVPLMLCVVTLLKLS